MVAGEGGTSESESLKLKFPLRLLDQVARLQMKNVDFCPLFQRSSLESSVPVIRLGGGGAMCWSLLAGYVVTWAHLLSIVMYRNLPISMGILGTATVCTLTHPHLKPQIK